MTKTNKNGMCPFIEGFFMIQSKYLIEFHHIFKGLEKFNALFFINMNTVNFFISKLN
jgi:hypothetical protein